MVALAGIIILGILAQWLAWRFKIPAILPLILIGLLFGPLSSLLTQDHQKLIEPIWDGTRGLFPADQLYNFVSISIGIILFEGGLTLKKSELLNTGNVIIKLITVGTLITFIGAGLACHYLFGISWSISFLFAALIIVTGPTVISPILRNIPLKKDVSSILKWESILIDPIGALVAVLVFEFITNVDPQGNFTLTAFLNFLQVIIIGGSIGFSAAFSLSFLIRKQFIPHYLLNVFSLAWVLLIYVLSDMFVHESGLLSVVVMGTVLGNINLPNIKELLYFKESLSVLLISILFILLSAHINMEDFYLLFTWKTLFLFLIITFIIRPLGVFMSTTNSNLKLNEKVFIGWLGPRGIVAAGIGSLFGLNLINNKEPDAEYITPLVFMMVLGTVLLNATTARIFAKLMGVFIKDPKTILMIGGSSLCRTIASFLTSNHREVIIIDNNPDNIRLAKEKGIESYNLNIFSDEDLNQIELNKIGSLIALTPNANVNQMAITRLQTQISGNQYFRLPSLEEIKSQKFEKPSTLFSKRGDYNYVNTLYSDYPMVNQIKIDSYEEYLKKLDIIEKSEESIPLFFLTDNTDTYVFPTLRDGQIETLKYPLKLVTLGKPIEF